MTVQEKLTVFTSLLANTEKISLDIDLSEIEFDSINCAVNNAAQCKDLFNEADQWFAYSLLSCHYDDNENEILTFMIMVFNDQFDEMIDYMPTNWKANRDRLEN